MLRAAERLLERVVFGVSLLLSAVVVVVVDDDAVDEVRLRDDNGKLARRLGEAAIERS